VAQFVRLVRAIVQASTASLGRLKIHSCAPASCWPTTTAAASRSDCNLAVITDPLGQLLRTTFLQPHDGLYTLFGRRMGPSILPVIDPDRFEWAIAESDGILNEAEQRLLAQRDRARRRAGCSSDNSTTSAHETCAPGVGARVVQGLWKRLTRTKLGKLVTWAVVTLAAGILTVYGVPALIKIIADLERDSLAAWGLGHPRVGRRLTHEHAPYRPNGLAKTTKRGS